jgi:MYXO-CTERM domain-containing protein
MRSAIVFALALVAGCSSPSERAPDLAPSAIGPRVVNGVPSTSAQDAVVMVLTQDQMCSGTLIAPNLVLTARHCVANIDENTGDVLGDLTPSALGIAIGVHESPQTANIVAQGKKIIDDGSKTLDSHDVGLIQLDKDIAGAKTALPRQAPATVGEMVTVVGYGEDGNGQLTDGRYQRTGIKVLAVGPKQFTFDAQSGQQIPVDVPPGTICTGESACHGDSGGPIFDAQGRIVGVVSGPGGQVDTCIDAPAFFSDITSHYTMIAQAAANAGHPLPAGDNDAGAGGGGGDAAPPGDTDAGISPPSGGDDNSGGDDTPDDPQPAPEPKPTHSGNTGSTTGTSCNASSGASDDGAVIAAVVAAIATRRRRRKA